MYWFLTPFLEPEINQEVSGLEAPRMDKRKLTVLPNASMPNAEDANSKLKRPRTKAEKAAAIKKKRAKALHFSDSSVSEVNYFTAFFPLPKICFDPPTNPLQPPILGFASL